MQNKLYFSGILSIYQDRHLFQIFFFLRFKPSSFKAIALFTFVDELNSAGLLNIAVDNFFLRKRTKFCVFELIIIL